MARRRRRRAGEAQPRRLERIGHERRGAALRGPPVLITCSCGRQTKLRFGDSWTCEDCGQTWDTSRIPRPEYDRIRNLQLRYRLLPVAFGLFVVALAAMFTLTGSAGEIVLLLPLALLSWFVFLRGAHRRRYQNAIAERPNWKLRGDRQ